MSEDKDRETQTLLGRWNHLSDDELTDDIGKALQGGSGWIPHGAHWAFASDVYVKITDAELKARVDRALVRLATDLREDLDVAERSCLAIELCARLKVSGVRDAMVDVLSRIGDATTINLAIQYQSINHALLDCPVPEAERFLLKQLDELPDTWFQFVSDLNNAPDPRFQRYFAAGMAYEALKKINPQAARRYASKFGQEGGKA
jgi:hypothetical protein